MIVEKNLKIQRERERKKKKDSYITYH